MQIKVACFTYLEYSVIHFISLEYEHFGGIFVFVSSLRYSLVCTIECLSKVDTQENVLLNGLPELGQLSCNSPSQWGENIILGIPTRK